MTACPPLPKPWDLDTLAAIEDEGYSVSEMQDRDIQWQQIVERKDALLRQALEAMQEYFDPDLDGIVAAITKELQ